MSPAASAEQSVGGVLHRSKQVAAVGASVGGVVREAVDRAGLVPCAVTAAAGIALVSVAPSVTVVGAAALAGIALAPLVPTLSARTAQRVGMEHAQRIAGWQLLAANVGAIAVPSLTGLVVDATGPGAAIVIALVVVASGLPALLAAARVN